MFFRGIFSTKFWFNRTSKISAVEGVIFKIRVLPISPSVVLDKNVINLNCDYMDLCVMDFIMT